MGKLATLQHLHSHLLLSNVDKAKEKMTTNRGKSIQETTKEVLQQEVGRAAELGQQAIASGGYVYPIRGAIYFVTCAFYVYSIRLSYSLTRLSVQASKFIHFCTPNFSCFS